MVPPGKLKESWRELAARVGLAYDPNTVSIEGVYRDRALKLDTSERVRGPGHFILPGILALISQEPVGVSGPGHNYTRIRLSVEHQANRYLSLSKKGGLARGIKTGHDLLDQEFRIESQPKEFAARVFASANLQRKMLGIKGAISVDGQELLFQQRGVETDVEYLHSLIELLCDVADSVEQVPHEAVDSTDHREPIEQIAPVGFSEKTSAEDAFSEPEVVYEIPLGYSGEVLELQPLGWGRVSRFFYKKEPIRDSIKQRYPKDFSVQADDGQAFQVRFSPRLFDSLPVVYVNNARVMYESPMLWWMVLARLTTALPLLIALVVFLLLLQMCLQTPDSLCTPPWSFGAVVLLFGSPAIVLSTLLIYFRSSSVGRRRERELRWGRVLKFLLFVVALLVVTLLWLLIVFFMGAI